MNPEDPNSEPLLPTAAGSLDDPLAREVQFLDWLRRLAVGRAAQESRIEAQYQASRKAAEQGLQESKKALISRLKTARRDTAYDHAEQRRHATSRYELETASVETKFSALQQFVARKFEGGRKRAERKVKEARWEAETVYEAQKDIPPRQLKAFEQTTTAWLARAYAEHEEARRLLAEWRQPWPDATSEPAPSVEGADYVARLRERVNFVAEQRAALARLRVPPLAASPVLAWVYVVVGLLLAGAVLVNGLGPLAAGATVLISAALGAGTSIYLRRLARSHTEQIYPALREAGREAEALAECAVNDARAHAAAQLATMLERRESALLAAEEKYQTRIDELTRERNDRLEAPSARYPQRLAEIAACRDRDLETAEDLRARREAEILREEAELVEIDERYQRQKEEIEQRHTGHRDRLTQQWQTGLARLQSFADQIRGDDAAVPGGRWITDWSATAGGAWPRASAIPAAIRFGQFRVPMAQIPQGVPADQRLAQLTPQGYSLPALLSLPERPSLVLQAYSDGRRVAIEAMQAVMLRLLMTIPPGKLRFTIIDPVGLGENFAAFMHLADYNEALVSSRIWTEPRHIEQRLADLSEHMENVIQKYLRNEFQTIEQYNREAGEIAEPFRFLVVANFPANFSDAAQRRLASIAANGARCGVYALIMADAQVSPGPTIALADLAARGTTLVWKEDRFAWQDDRFGSFELSLDAPPPPAQVTEILHTAGRYAIEAGRVEVPFEVIAPAPDQFWSSTARTGIDVPLGRVGAKRLQHLRLGHGTSQHVLVAGKTGSGKSTLLHALITNLALRYSPDEVELYLVDFKQGVEFKTYATHALPHARVVAIESDREFGLSVLGRLDAELKTRADQFRALGVQDLAGFRQADGQQPMPRLLLIVDEFQEFFVEDDKISADAALLLDRLVRQGCAFGIHVLLGSQTLAGTYTLARSTIGQMAVRIALQCSEGDAHLILSEENSAARLLSRAGEAIYNDSNGLVEGNHPFQIVWLSDDRREALLGQVQWLAERRGGAPRAQVVFEGNTPADPERNQELAELLSAARSVPSSAAARAWLGEAVAIKDPTSITLRPQSGSNVLMVGQNEDAALGMLAVALVSLSAQHPRSKTLGARFYILDGSLPGSAAAASLAVLPGLTPDPTRLVSWRELPAVVNELALEVERRQTTGDAQFPPIYVLIHGLQKLRDLRRQEDDFGFSRSADDRPPDPARQFCAVLRDGPAVAVHSLVWCDSVNNLNRAWDRQTLREFEMRVAFQMSGNDSSTLIDTPLAGKLGAHRALFHSEELGVLEKFRPYRWPAESWLDWVRQQLHGPPGECDNPAQRAVV